MPTSDHPPGVRPAVTQRTLSRSPGWLYLFGIALVTGLCLTFQSEVETSFGYGYGLRVTARIAFLCFIVAYVARPLVQLCNRFHGLLRHRRYWGLAAAFVHTVHFGYVVLYLRQTDVPLDPLTIVFGGLAFVLFWILAATSNGPSVRKLGRNWKRLHRFGMHYIWLIYLYTFAGNYQGDFISTLLIAAGVSAMGMRLAAYWLQRRRMA